MRMKDWLSDLLFIDQRDGQFESERDRLNAQGLWTNLGTYGPFFWNLPRPTGYEFKRPLEVECASVWAQVAFRLGYLQLDRTLNLAEWETIASSINRFRSGDWHQEEVTALFGLPSFVIGSLKKDHRCQCYATADPEQPWFFFDYEFWQVGYADLAYGSNVFPYEMTIGGKPWNEHPDLKNPLLRDVRIPAPNFEERLVLTEYAHRIQNCKDAR